MIEDILLLCQTPPFSNLTVIDNSKSNAVISSRADRNIEKEFERKAMINEEVYYCLIETLSPSIKCKKAFQINYYYDTPMFTFMHAGETLRVRQIENELKVQYKYNKSITDNIRTCDEFSAKIYSLPAKIIVNKIETTNIGSLITERTNFHIDKYLISIDKNYYLGLVDFEIEIESEKICDVPLILNNIEFKGLCKGKYERYLDKLLEQKFICEVQI